MIKKAFKKYKKNRGSCGLGLLRTSKKDPFEMACKNHDAAYVMFKGTKNEKIRKGIDKTFLKEMLRKDGLTVVSRFRAHIYYALSRVFGFLPWYLGRGK